MQVIRENILYTLYIFLDLFFKEDECIFELKKLILKLFLKTIDN